MKKDLAIEVAKQMAEPKPYFFCDKCGVHVDVLDAETIGMAKAVHIRNVHFQQITIREAGECSD